HLLVAREPLTYVLDRTFLHDVEVPCAGLCLRPGKGHDEITGIGLEHVIRLPDPAYFSPELEPRLDPRDVRSRLAFCGHCTPPLIVWFCIFTPPRTANDMLHCARLIWPPRIFTF